MSNGEHAGKLILIIENDYLRARLLAVSLEEHLGADHLEIARDGNSALTIIREHGPDAILLNMNLSRPSGIEFLRILSQDEGGVPSFKILAMAEQGQGDLRSAAWSFRTSGFLETPFAPPQLASEVATILEND